MWEVMDLKVPDFCFLFWIRIVYGTSKGLTNRDNSFTSNVHSLFIKRDKFLKIVKPFKILANYRFYCFVIYSSTPFLHSVFIFCFQVELKISKILFFVWSSPCSYIEKRILFSVRKQNRNPWLHDRVERPFLMLLLSFFSSTISLLFSYIILTRKSLFWILMLFMLPIRNAMWWSSKCVGFTARSFPLSFASPCIQKRKNYSRCLKVMNFFKYQESCILKKMWKENAALCWLCNAYICIEYNPLFIIYNSNCLKSFPCVVAGALHGIVSNCKLVKDDMQETGKIIRPQIHSIALTLLHYLLFFFKILNWSWVTNSFRLYTPLHCKIILLRLLKQNKKKYSCFIELLTCFNALYFTSTTWCTGFTVSQRRVQNEFRLKVLIKQHRCRRRANIRELRKILRTWAVKHQQLISILELKQKRWKKKAKELIK